MISVTSSGQRKPVLKAKEKNVTSTSRAIQGEALSVQDALAMDVESHSDSDIPNLSDADETISDADETISDHGEPNLGEIVRNPSVRLPYY
jgi:hypothetical protein